MKCCRASSSFGRQDFWLLALVGGLAAVVLVAVGINLLRIRERAARLASQQATIDLARQMCHELRNGLWAFALEGKNLAYYFEIVDGYMNAEPAAFARAAEKQASIPRRSNDFVGNGLGR